MIELYLLEQLAAVARHATLSAAAQELHITQPALTRSIQKLEKELGFPLFTHEKNKITINETGKIAAAYAERVLQAERDLRDAVTRFERSRHTISLACCAPAPLVWLQHRLMRCFPTLSLTSQLSNDEAALLQGLQEKRHQIIVLSHAVALPGLTCRKLFSEQLYASVMPAHPAASMDRITFADLNGEIFLIETSLGIWQDLVRKRMPASRFIMQDTRQDLDTLLKSSSLPAFSTDIGQKLLPRKSQRKDVLIADDDACITFYIIYSESDAPRFDSL